MRSARKTTGDNWQLGGTTVTVFIGNIDRDVLEVVLPDAADPDRAVHRFPNSIAMSHVILIGIAPRKSRLPISTPQ
jgi:hypothetical protein